MSRRSWAPGVFAGLLILSGCSTSTNSDPAAQQPSSTRSTSEMSMAPGMSMGPGESMSDMNGPDASTPATAAGSGRPSAGSRMVCAPEIRREIGRLLALRPAPRGRTTWVDHVYTCTYRLPVGPLVLQVTESRDVPAARRAFAGLRNTLGPTQALSALEGLGLPAYETRDGTAVFLKDNKMLRVDATRLAPGTARRSPSSTEVAYEVATDVMGSWAED